MKSDAPLIELVDIKKQVGTEIVIKILHGVSLSVTKGEFVAIMGPSGSGKSTLMNIIGFLDVATGGTYRFRGEDISELTEDQLARYRGEEVGFVFQAFNLLPKTTVYQNVKMPLMYATKRVSEAEQKKRTDKLIKSVGLEHRANNLSNQLSGGEKQRVAIARALINEPEIILADEPTGNLDSKTGVQIMKILQELNDQGKTVILVTHEKATAEHARRIVYIKDGKIESDTRVNSQRRARSSEGLK